MFGRKTWAFASLAVLGIVVLLVVSGASASASPATAAPDRSVFVTQNGSRFFMIGDGRWIGQFRNGPDFRYFEAMRTFDFVELRPVPNDHDAVRLHDNGAYFWKFDILRGWGWTQVPGFGGRWEH